MKWVKYKFRKTKLILIRTLMINNKKMNMGIGI